MFKARMFLRAALAAPVLAGAVLCLPSAIESAAFPKPQGWVSDYAQVLDARTRAQLASLLGRLTEKTGAEIAVVTIASLEGSDIETYATELYADWGIGKKGKDNGALILVSIEDRKIRIETGYGLEGILPDAKCGDIIRNAFVPYFKTNRYSQGLIAGTLEVAGIVAKDAGTSLEELGAQAPARGRYRRGRRSPLGMLFPIILMIVAWPLARRNPFLFFLLMSGMGGHRGGWSGGGFGGGFGGFGGGLSGGGGASGGW